MTIKEKEEAWRKANDGPGREEGRRAGGYMGWGGRKVRAVVYCLTMGFEPSSVRALTQI